MDLSDVFEVGNPWMLGGYENQQEESIDRMIDYVNANFCGRISIGMFRHLMSKFGVDYQNLPQFLKDRLDTIDVY